MKKHNLSLMLILTSYFVTTGFIFGNAETDVSNFIRETKEKLKVSNVKLPEIPEIAEYKPYVYQSGNEDPFKLRPFVTDAVELAQQEEKQNNFCNSSDCGDSAPIEHIPYFLEGYDINSLAMAGTMMDANHQVSALIRTPDAGIQEIRVGEYIGRDNGMVLSIHPDHIVVQEKFKVPRGWQNRMATLELFD